jgi:hypothetical protein
MGTFCIVPVLSREEFDAIEFDAAFSGEHEAAAQRMSRLAVTGIQSPSMPRAEAFLRAGEQWLLADDPAAAASGFRLALADGGPVFVDPRVPLSRALFMLDKTAEARALIAELKEEGRRDPRVCDLVAEILVERSDLNGALDWATAGVQLCLQREEDRARRSGLRSADADPGDEDRAELRMLLSLRYRIRNDLGLPEDDYDRLLDEPPSGDEDAGTAAGRSARTVSESDAGSRSTRTTSPSAISPDRRPRAS